MRVSEDLDLEHQLSLGVLAPLLAPLLTPLPLGAGAASDVGVHSQTLAPVMVHLTPALPVGRLVGWVAVARIVPLPEDRLRRAKDVASATLEVAGSSTRGSGGGAQWRGLTPGSTEPPSGARHNPSDARVKLGHCQGGQFGRCQRGSSGAAKGVAQPLPG